MQPDAHKRALIAGSIGNFIEWYEFAVYGFLATVIAKNFFQLEGEAGLTSLILTTPHLPSPSSSARWGRWCLAASATGLAVNRRLLLCWCS